MGKPLRLVVAIATTGRAKIVSRVVDRLKDQTRTADTVISVGAQQEDIGSIPPRADLMLRTAPKGSCLQRNDALDLSLSTCDIIVFLDDDFIPARDFLENVDRIFTDQPDFVGATGILLADGAGREPIELDTAIHALDHASTFREEAEHSCRSFYGCNMAIRASAIGALRFDENIPLYG